MYGMIVYVWHDCLCVTFKQSPPQQCYSPVSKGVHISGVDSKRDVSPIYLLKKQIRHFAFSPKFVNIKHPLNVKGATNYKNITKLKF